MWTRTKYSPCGYPEPGSWTCTCGTLGRGPLTGEQSPWHLLNSEPSPGTVPPELSGFPKTNKTARQGVSRHPAMKAAQTCGAP